MVLLYSSLRNYMGAEYTANTVALFPCSCPLFSLDIFCKVLWVVGSVESVSSAGAMAVFELTECSAPNTDSMHSTLATVSYRIVNSVFKLANKLLGMRIAFSN